MLRCTVTIRAPEAYSLDLTSEPVLMLFAIGLREMEEIRILSLFMKPVRSIRDQAWNETLEGRARNRRLDIYLIPGEKMVDMARRGELINDSSRCFTEFVFNLSAFFLFLHENVE